MTDTWTTAADYIDQRADDIYGRHMFPDPPPEFDYTHLDQWLRETYGFRIDRISADMYRRAHHSIAASLRDADYE